MKLSVIVPYVREWPQVAFTLRSIAESLKGIDFEIIAVDNLQKNMAEDRGSQNIKNMAKQLPWLRYFHKGDKLSHWQCKNLAMQKATGEVFWFVDAHCIAPSEAVKEAYGHYCHRWQELNGSLHFPLTYHILEKRQLIYKSVVDAPKGDYAYSFHTLDPKRFKGERTMEVPSMSTCGMMIHKEIMADIGYWPEELGIYGGGEHFLNYVCAVMGYKKHIFNTNGSSLYHHGDRRGYSWNHHDQQRNRAIATYMFGGEDLLYLWLSKSAKLRDREQSFMFRDILEKCKKQRENIKSKQKTTIDEFVKGWEKSVLMRGNLDAQIASN